jgi:hypothetical protein
MLVSTKFLGISSSKGKRRFSSTPPHLSDKDDSVKGKEKEIESEREKPFSENEYEFQRGEEIDSEKEIRKAIDNSLKGDLEIGEGESSGSRLVDKKY